MRFLRCLHAEFLLVAPRLTRTRLGVSLVALGVTLVWLNARGLDPRSAALLAGALGAIVGAGTIAASDSDRAALTTALTHPTTSLAVATGRWVAMVAPAAALVLGCTVAIGWHSGTALAGVVAAAAVGSCALAVALALGRSGVLTLFILIAVAGAVAPERLVDLARPGVVRLAAASALELGPALWHYRDIPIGDLGALLHALAWTALGILLASAFVARQRVRR
jgi:hypothetical protein